MAVRPELVGETLTRQYRLSCELFSTYPQAHFTHQLSQGSLDLHLDKVDLDHLEALCHTLKNKVSPSSLRVIVPPDKKAVPPMVSRVVERAVEGVGVCVVASLTLNSLALDGVRLRGRNLKLLCEGLRKARTLKTLVMRNCGLGDTGTESVCQAVKNVPSITHLSLVNCGVAERGATSIACLIKHQRLNRDSAMWQDTLRQRQPHLDSMKGLRRLTLNSNPALGDQGVAAITEALTEDLWIKAVDLQHCGIGVEVEASCRALLHTNQTLEVVDLRNNPFLPDSVVGEVTSLLQGRYSEANSQYSWLKTSEVEEETVLDHKKGGGTGGYRASGRIVRVRRGKHFPHESTSRRPKPPSQLGVPWRVEHRLYERKEGLTPGSMVKDCIREWEESVGEASEPSKESVPEGEVNIKMRKKLQLYKKKYQKEREHRQKLERKLSRIQTQLQGLHTLDENTVTHIEECFLKFHILLSMMHSSGEELQPSPGTVSSSHHPSPQPGTSHIHPGTFTPLPASTIPFNASTSHSHPIPAENTVYEPEMSVGNNDEDMNQKILRPKRNVNIGSQHHTSHSSVSEMQGKDDPRITSEIMASDQYRKSPFGSTQHQLESKENGDERMLSDLSNGETDKGTDEEMITKIKKKKEKKENMSSKREESVSSHSSAVIEKMKQSVAIQVDDTQGCGVGEANNTAMKHKLITPSIAGSVAMRMEFEENTDEEVCDEWNNGKINDYTNGIEGKKSQPVRENEELEGKNKPAKELSFKTNKTNEIHTLQGLMKGRLHEGRKQVEEAYPSTTKSQGSGNSQSSLPSQSPLASQSYHATQSPSQLPQKTPISLSQLSQEGTSGPNQSPQETQLYPKVPIYYENQSSGSESPSSQSPPSQSLQESYSPERIKSPQNWSPKKIRPMQRSQFPRRTNSPQKQSPKKSRSPEKEPPGLQGSEVSETDDEKMRNLNVWLQDRTRGRASTPSSSSSVSISEHLQKSHSSWTKNKGLHKGGHVEAAREEEGEVEELPDGSEIDLSDFEDFSLSGITLTNTSVPEDIHTPREEDF